MSRTESEQNHDEANINFHRATRLYKCEKSRRGEEKKYEKSTDTSLSIIAFFEKRLRQFPLPAGHVKKFSFVHDPIKYRNYRNGFQFD